MHFFEFFIYFSRILCIIISINGFSGVFEEKNFDGTQKSPISQELIDNQNNLEDFRINQVEGFLHPPVPNQRVRKVLKEVLDLNPKNN